MRHSDLKNDLHYAKLKTFTGNPATITPDFFDQILTATDTNKVYRATGTNQGQLVELSPPPVLPEQRVLFDATFPNPQSQTQLLVRVDQNRIYRANGILPTDWLEIVGADGGGGGGSSAISVGTNPPQNAPDLLGQQYFDSRNGHLFIAIADGANLIWRNTTPPVVVVSQNLDDQSLLYQYPNAYGSWVWGYIDHHPTSDLYIDAQSLGFINCGSDLTAAINLQGAGIYVLHYELTDPNNDIPSWGHSPSLFFDGLSGQNSVSPDETSFTLSQIHIDGRYWNGFYISPDRRLGAKVTVSDYLTGG